MSYHPGRGDRIGDGNQRKHFRFLKPSDDYSKPRSGPLVNEEREGESVGGEEGAVIYNNPCGMLGIQTQRARLPIFKNRNHILYLCEKYRTVIVVGETGCGKSTQVPQYLYEAGWCCDGRMIGVTQPRRVAAVTLASRVAEEKESLLGQDVGYVVRFDDVTDDQTKIKFMTDGILLREMMTDPLLSKYSVLMVDEAHERTTNTDILLGLLKKVMHVRKDLRIIVSSATLDAERFRDFFETNESSNSEKNTATIISVEGRTHPVTILYTKTSVPNYVQQAVNTVIEIHQKEMPGDVLVFLTGQDEVEEVCDKLRDEVSRLRNVDKLWIVPCYGALPAKEQMKAFDSTPHGTRKVVVATNIAEASITIPGIAYVVDCGFVKLRALNPKNGIETLMKVPISRASSEQRAGRAGRIRPGKTYRLYPESQLEKLSPSTVPEIQRCHLAAVVLQLKALGIQNVHKFHYLSRPPASSMVCGLELLFALGALDEKSLLTNPLGVQMSEFPLPPMHAKCLLNSAEFECGEEMATIIAMLQIQDVFVMPSGAKHKAEVMKRKFAVAEGDHLTYLNVYTNFIKHGRSKHWCGSHFLNYRGLCRAESVRSQLIGVMKRFGVEIKSCKGLIGSNDRICRCLVSGFFSQAARYHYTGKYLTVKEDFPFNVFKGSAIMYRKDYPKWLIFSEVMQDSIRDVTVIDPEWLYELAPHFYEFGTDAEIARKRIKT